ncbi:hypothetical protein FJQ54_06320 [Sandaracinobacter neustonicus]|uniref:Outer membrane protein beta-barrel domain-containing protein n=1 Tax=Sandaracinobacter neustonicus TaxID=1715348 RepID=A0A501XNV4_9SPHN|nr:hypothetical protein [Sandaracinobacter neustonicus]TPE62149.1 hypothetical protein FJQ54_06320 [Sandaracinobacter neustonicus]
MRTACVASLILGLISAPAAASDGGWEFNVAPYLWGAGIDGRLAHPALPQDVSVEVPFSDIWKNLDIGGMVAFEARKGRVGLLLDGLYVKTSNDATIPQLGLPVSLGATTFTGMAAGQYRIVEDGIGSLDLLAGARYWSMDTRISYDLPAAVPLPPGVPHAYDHSEKAQWVDGMVGAKAVVHLSRRISMNAHGMLGAGGSRFSSDAMLALGFGLGSSTSLLLGYRHLDADYRDGGLQLKTRMHGPAAGMSIRF